MRKTLNSDTKWFESKLKLINLSIKCKLVIKLSIFILNLNDGNFFFFFVENFYNII